MKVPAHLKPNENDAVALDLSSLGKLRENFPLQRYTPIAILGNNARATVILARDKQRGTKVAVKVFKRIKSAMQATFTSEVKKNQQLNHTSIAKVLDFEFQNNKAPYLVTEYKDGFNVEQYLALHGVPSYDVAIKILIDICESIMYAQKQGVLHRDIRPANVIFFDDLNSDPSVFLTDFALPKVKADEEFTEVDDAINLTSDEARNMEYTEKSEVYAIGCIGYWLLTGRPPFRDGSVQEIKNAHALKLPPQISSIKFDNKRPKELEEIIERCLEKDPNVRFESVAKLLERLEVFPRRVQMKKAAVLAAKNRAKLLRILIIAFAILALGIIAFLIFRPH
ncbi:MAG: serine/threonine protein kinase [Leptolyngbya sp.]|nr:serine/threonine protein kinase [Candidatus Melainabacteria bacterium]